MENTNTNSLPMVQQTNKVVMTTVDVAEQTGKRHDHVMRDARTMLIELYGLDSLPKFGESYTADNGQTYECYGLPKIELLTLISGYNIQLRAKIIRRLNELEILKQQGNLIGSNTEALIRLEERLITRFEQMVESLKPKKVIKSKKTPTMKENTLFENQEALHNKYLDLIEKSIALAAEAGRPFTHTRSHGICQNRKRLPKEIQQLGTKQLNVIIRQLLDSGRIIKCRLSMGVGRLQWLDVPTGNFGQGKGVLYPND